jgi:uncharacterized membrane protein (TIGR02234 family)
MAAARREFVLVLLAGAAGAALVVLAVRQPWAHALFIPPKPLPGQDIAVTGQQLVPLAGALALAALACLAAVIATRSVIRRAFGVLLAVLGAGAAAAAVTAVRAPAVLAAALGKGGGAVGGALDGPLGGSTTGGASAGGAVHEIIIAGPGRVILAGAPWRAAVLAGAAAIVLAGLATAWHGQRWPAMGARFERAAGPPAPGQSATGRPGPAPGADADSATMWESLNRDVDPTVDDAARG